MTVEMGDRAMGSFVLVLRVIIADDGTGRPLGYCVKATRHAGGYGGELVKKKQMEGGREETGLAERKRCWVEEYSKNDVKSTLLHLKL